MTDVSYRQAGGPRPQLTGSDDQKPARIVGASAEMHELGNLIVALQFCLRQLGGRQSTDELEGVVQSGLEVCEQGIVAFRRVREAVRVRP
jgi:hypothetical protein